MNRRNFLKTTSLVTAGFLFPALSAAAPIDFGQVGFDAGIYNSNNAQTIMVFLYGGPSELGGNLTNIAQIKANSQSSYDNYFRGVTATANGFWQEAGGTIMEELLASGDMNIFRTCYSKIRDDEGNRSHGNCVSQNQRGVLNDEDTAGIFSIIANTLYQNGAINANTKLPFLTMEGESTFFGAPDFTMQSFLKPTALNSDLSNPYARHDENQWFYYTDEEREGKSWKEYTSQRALLDRAMDILGQRTNRVGKIKENFDKRVELDIFINTMKNSPTPEGITYPDNQFAKNLETAIKIMSNNPDTKIISLGNGGLGGWDDHNEARDYPMRMEELFSAIRIAVNHIKAEGKDGDINIMVWGEFGRNVNLNNALGWDHGNLQNLYVFGGKNYFNHVGVVGETVIDISDSINRMYLKPKSGTYWFEPASVAATLYKIYGITNPEYLTGGHSAISAGLLS
jgi:hypothetical protein